MKALRFFAPEDVRLVDVPDAYQVGDIVAVPIPASGLAPAPQFSSHQAAVWQLDVGFALDLGGAAATAG